MYFVANPYYMDSNVQILHAYKIKWGQSIKLELKIYFS